MARSPDALELVCADFPSVLELLCGLGLRVEVIYPADDPHTAVLSRDGARIRLTARPDAPAIPSGLPTFRPEFVLSRAGGEAGAGRAGMSYRDLIPGRLGGRYIASHIAIPEGGAVADWVHYHRVAFQLICVRRNWVRVVYQDQGEPFIMAAGDMVIQPPGIRHRVLESAPGLEVVEITCPALHETFADHDMALPNGAGGAARDYDGQRFLRHLAGAAPWTAWNGGEAQETGVSAATGGLAEARLVRPAAAPSLAVPPHEGELAFGFVLEGSARLDYAEGHELGPADAFAIPPGEAWRLTGMSRELRLLHVTTAIMR